MKPRGSDSVRVRSTAAIGSVASYFKRHGWVAGEPVVSRALVLGERADEGLTTGIEPVKTVGELRALGWSSHDALRDDLPVTAFRLEGDQLTLLDAQQQPVLVFARNP